MLALGGTISTTGTTMTKSCEYKPGCKREGTRFFNAPPMKQWLCEEHFHEVLNSFADVEAAALRQFAADWQEHIENHFRENNLIPPELTERQFTEELRRWLQKRYARKLWVPSGHSRMISSDSSE